jgi:hypothetical protein
MSQRIGIQTMRWYRSGWKSASKYQFESQEFRLRGGLSDLHSRLLESHRPIITFTVIDANRCLGNFLCVRSFSSLDKVSSHNSTLIFGLLAVSWFCKMSSSLVSRRGLLTQSFLVLTTRLWVDEGSAQGSPIFIGRHSDDPKLIL